MRTITVLAAAAAVSGAGAPALAQTDAGWTEAPTYAQAAQAYPGRARGAGVGGAALVSCTANSQGYLRDCAVLKEQPDGMGFGAAARKLAERLRTATAKGSEVRVMIGFSPDMLKGAAAYVNNPTWSLLPSPADFQGAFPKTEGGPNAARVVLDCQVVDGGVLSGCTVESEEPAGQGLGAGALALAPKFRVGLLTADGVPTLGAHVRVPIRYQLAPAAPDAKR